MTENEEHFIKNMEFFKRWNVVVEDNKGLTMTLPMDRLISNILRMSLTITETEIQEIIKDCE